MARRSKKTEEQMKLFEEGGLASQKDKADSAFSQMDDMIKKGISEEVRKQDGTVVSKTYKNPAYAAEDVLRMLRAGEITIEQAEKFLSEQKEASNYAEGGYEDGGLKDEGGTIDPVSGNDVPAGSTQAEVRDDIPAQLSEGEFVFPADVTRYIGLENLMELRNKAKKGLAQMDAMGQMGNSEEATMDDTAEMDVDIDAMIDEFDPNDPETMQFALGGVVKAQAGAVIPGQMPPQQFSYGYQAPQPQQVGYAPPQVPQGQFPDYSKFVSQPAKQAAGQEKGITEQRQYIGPNGEMITILFMDGKPQQEIPAGYKVYKPEEVKPEVAAPVVQQPTGNDGDGGGGGGVDQTAEMLDKIDTNFLPSSIKAGYNKRAGLGALGFMGSGAMGGPVGAIVGAIANGEVSKNVVENQLAGMMGITSEQFNKDYVTKSGLFGMNREYKTDKINEKLKDQSVKSLEGDYYAGEDVTDLEAFAEQTRTVREDKRDQLEADAIMAMAEAVRAGYTSEKAAAASGLTAEQRDTMNKASAEVSRQVSEGVGGGRGEGGSETGANEAGVSSADYSRDPTGYSGSFSKGGVIQQTQRALKSSRKKK